MEQHTPKNKRAVVAVFKTHKEAEDAVKELDRIGFDMKKLSIIGKGFQTEEQVMGYVETEDRVRIWGKRGAFWGMLMGLLVGSAFLVVPGLGHVVIVGPLVKWLAGAAAGGAAFGGSLSIIGAILKSLGIPKESILKYERAIKAEKYLLIAYDTAANIEDARGLLETSAELADIHKVDFI